MTDNDFGVGALVVGIAVRVAPGDTGKGSGFEDRAAARFWHMGQFNASYRRLFDELPSETLKQSR
jgi:hypothetical protein